MFCRATFKGEHIVRRGSSNAVQVDLALYTHFSLRSAVFRQFSLERAFQLNGTRVKSVSSCLQNRLGILGGTQCY